MSATEREFRGYNELSKEEQAFIDEYVQNYKNTFPVNIERKMGLETDRGRQIVEKHDEILKARRNAYETGDLTDEDLYTVEDYRADVEDAPESEEAIEEYGIDVVVENEDGSTVEDADVTVDGEENWEFSLYESGTTVTVEATAPDYQSDSRDVTVDENTTVTLTLEPEAAEEGDEDEEETTTSTGEFTIPETSEIDRNTLEEYEYYELQQIAPEYGVQGNIKEEDMVDQILESAQGEAETESDAEEETTSRRGPQTAEEKAYTDLSPLQQRVIDQWVQDPNQKKGDIEDKADASPGYSARLFRKYGHIRDRRRDAYEDGVLTDEELNTPEFDEFIEDTDLPREEWERIPEDEQPMGTPLEEVEGGDEYIEKHAISERGETDEQEGEEEEQDSAAEAEEETGDQAEVEQLELPETEQPAQPTGVEDLRDDVTTLRDAVEDIQSNMELLNATISDLSSDESALADRLETLEHHSGGLSSVDEQPSAEEGDQTVRLDTAEWVTVVRALAEQEGSEDVLYQIIEQVH